MASVVLLATGCGGLPGVTPATSAVSLNPTLAAAAESSVATAVAATVQALPAAAPTTTPLPDAPQVACRLWLTATVDVPYREGPGTAYPLVGQMLAGQSAEVLNHDGFYSWWLVPLIDGRSAWVPGEAVQLSDCANIPFITPTPAP